MQDTRCTGYRVQDAKGMGCEGMGAKYKGYKVQGV